MLDFTLSATELAPKLLGMNFIYDSPQSKLVGKIVEVEAYNQDDPAAHTFKGQNFRNRAMYEAGGCLYFYRIYGLHTCVNIVTGPKGRGEALLLRAFEPLEGIEIMQKNRGTENILKLTNGPARLVQAFGMSMGDYGAVLGKSAFSLEDGEKILNENIVQTTRVGITKAANSPYRFYIRDNPFISKR